MYVTETIYDNLFPFYLFCSLAMKIVSSVHVKYSTLVFVFVDRQNFNIQLSLKQNSDNNVLFRKGDGSSSAPHFG